MPNPLADPAVLGQEPKEKKQSSKINYDVLSTLLPDESPAETNPDTETYANPQTATSVAEVPAPTPPAAPTPTMPYPANSSSSTLADTGEPVFKKPLPMPPLKNPTAQSASVPDDDPNAALRSGFGRDGDGEDDFEFDDDDDDDF